MLFGSRALRPWFLILLIGPVLLTADLNLSAAQPGQTPVREYEDPPPRRYNPPFRQPRQPFVVQMTHAERELLERGEIPLLNYVGGGLLSTYFGFGIGQAVQGRWSDTGWIFTVGSAASSAVLLVGITRCLDHRTTYHVHTSDNSHGNGVDHRHERESCGLALGGFLGLVGFHVWGLLDAWIGPAFHNSRVRKLKRKFGLASTKLELTPVAGGMTGGFSVRF